MPSIDLSHDATTGVATVTINNPERKNAANFAMFEEIGRVFAGFTSDPSVRAVVLTGAGDDFCSGADLGAGTGEERVHGLEQLRRIHKMPVAILDTPQPVIARVDGVAVGAGLSMALACDMIVASDRSRFSAIFAKRGLTLDCGMSWLLPRAVGVQRAKEMALLAEVLDAERAKEIGLVNRLVPAADLDATIADMTATLADGPPIAMSMSKRLINQSFNQSFSASLEAEGYAQNVNFGTKDTAEALSAFVERRAPEFTGW